MYYLGIDVAKAKLDCCLTSDDKTRYKTFANNANGRKALVTWLLKYTDNACAGMESTGSYHEPIAHVLYEAGMMVYVLNPSRVKSFARGMGFMVKTDKVDSKMLATYMVINQSNHKLQPWQPLTPAMQELKLLLARRDALVKDLVKEQGRLEQLSYMAHSTRIESAINESMTFMTQAIERLDKQIKEHIDSDPTLKQDKELLESIPAVGERSSLTLLNVLYSHEFDSASQLAAYLGLVPLHHQSGANNVNNSRIGKTSSAKIRSQLYMAAVVAIQHNPRIKAHYQKLIRKGKAKMQALIAAMRKLVHICFGVIKNQTPYDEHYLAKTTQST